MPRFFTTKNSAKPYSEPLFSLSSPFFTHSIGRRPRFFNFFFDSISRCICPPTFFPYAPHSRGCVLAHRRDNRCNSLHRERVCQSLNCSKELLICTFTPR